MAIAEEPQHPRVEGSIRNATALRVKRVCFTRFSRSKEAKGGRNKCPSSTDKYDINVTSTAMQFPELRQQMQRVDVKLDLNEDCSIRDIGICLSSPNPCDATLVTLGAPQHQNAR